MEFEWDEGKNAGNVAKHGVSFELARQFLWAEAIIELDARRDYGELRYVARGPAEDGLGYHIAFTMRGSKLRIITMRRFSRKDYERYGV